MKRFLRRIRHRHSAIPFQQKIALTVLIAVALVLVPGGAANADTPDWVSIANKLSPAAGATNWVADQVKEDCSQPGMEPEVYGSGFDGLAISPNPADKSYYGQYGTTGTYWNWIPQGCTDFTTPIGNQVANLIFNFAKTIDTVTISVYAVSASDSTVSWLKDTADNLITSIGKVLQVGYLTLVVMIGALALIWWGLFKRRATRVTEGTIWMVCAAAAFLILINRPEIFTTAGSSVTTATQGVVDAALSPVDTPVVSGGKSKPVSDRVIKGDQKAELSHQSNTVCIPSKEGGNPQYSGRWTTVQKNANSMWSALVCKPWLQGEFGTANPNERIVQGNADKLLQAQAFSQAQAKNPAAITDAATDTKAQQYLQVANRIHNEHGDTALFTGSQYTQRIGIAFAALFAAIVAGILILLLSLALIIFKLGFLLLLITGPVFLLIGIHPGWGRVIAVRWVEILLSSLLKQALVAGLLGLLLFLYAIIMGTGGLTWVMQIVLIALVSFAAFFYRKPFQHLFAAVGTDSIGSRILSNATAGTNAFKTGTGALTAPARVNRWSLRKTQPITDAAAATGHPAAVGVAMASRLATGNPTDDDVSGRTAGRVAAGSRNGDGSDPTTGPTRSGGGTRAGTNAPPLNLPRPGDNNGPNGPGGPGTTPRGGIRPGGGPTTVGPRPGSGSGSGSTPVGAGWGPRPGDAPPIWSTRSSGGAPPRNPSGGTPSRTPSNAPAPSSSGGTPPASAGSGGGSSPRSGSGGWFGSSWRRSGGESPSRSGGDGGSRRSGGGGWFGGGSGSSRRGGEKRDSTPPPRRTENRDTGSGPAPWRKRESAPPLWAKPSKPQAPDIPFWTRPDK